MKAYVLHNIDDLRFEDVPLPELKEGYVLVKVKAAGVCSSDIPRIFKNGTYHFPTIPGHEFSGEVVKVSDESNASLIGKRVGIFPLIPCKVCDQCLNHNYEMCRNYNYLGSRCDGGFADYVAAPVWNLIELPDSVSYEQGALLEPLSVAYHTVNKLTFVNDAKIAIMGTGTIGLFIAMILQSMGKDVSVIGRNDSKKNLIDRCGIKNYINTSTAKDVPNFDVIIEAVGSNESVNQCIQIANFSAQIVLMGNPYGDMHIDKKTYWQILRRQLTIVGTWNSSYENNAESDWSKVLDLIEKKQISPEKVITHLLPKENLMDGLTIMKDHLEVYGKVMVKFYE